MDEIDDKDAKFAAHDLVVMLEERVFGMSKEDAKTREYRDRCNKLQMNLKVRLMSTHFVACISNTFMFSSFNR